MLCGKNLPHPLHHQTLWWQYHAVGRCFTLAETRMLISRDGRKVDRLSSPLKIKQLFLWFLFISWSCFGNPKHKMLYWNIFCQCLNKYFSTHGSMKALIDISEGERKNSVFGCMNVVERYSCKCSKMPFYWGVIWAGKGIHMHVTLVIHKINKIMDLLPSTSCLCATLCGLKKWDPENHTQAWCCHVMKSETYRGLSLGYTSQSAV